MLRAANGMLGTSLIVQPTRCGEYWRRWAQLMALGRELEEARKEHSGQEGWIMAEMDIIAKGISWHVNCCEQCQNWWRSFEIGR